jgi:hypothetical protein
MDFNFIKKCVEYFCKKEKSTIFASSLKNKAYKKRAFSSVGSEHLPYKQGVTGSNPVSPTTEGKT